MAIITLTVAVPEGWVANQLFINFSLKKRMKIKHMDFVLTKSATDSLKRYSVYQKLLTKSLKQ